MASSNLTNEQMEDRRIEYADKVKKYRQQENDMKAFNESLQASFKTQQDEMSRLELENFQLLEELQTQESQITKQQREQTVVQKAADVQEQEIQELIDKIERELNTSKRLDDKVKNLQREIIEQKRKQSAATGGSAGSSADRTGHLTKQVKIIENRLDKANKRFSTAMNQNKSLRDKIDELRRERVVFEQVYVKLEKELGIKRRDLARMIESVDKINEDRDQAIAQIQAFQAQSKMNRHDDDMRVEEFDDYDVQKIQMAKKAARKTQTPLQRLQNALLGMQGTTLSTEEIVKKFVSQEEQHFELFNNVSQLKTEVANTESDIFDIQGKLEKLGMATEVSPEAPNTKVIAKRELDEKMTSVLGEKERMVLEIKQIETELQQTMDAIKSLGLITLELEAELEQSWDLVRKTQTDVADIQNKRDVTQENVSAYMSTIEQTVAQLLLDTGNHALPPQAEQAEEPQFDFAKMPQLSEQEFQSDVMGDQEEDVMFMSMADFKKKLDMMSMNK